MIVRAERIDDVTLAWTTAGDAPFPLEAALDGTCFRITAVRDVPLRACGWRRPRCAPIDSRLGVGGSARFAAANHDNFACPMTDHVR